MGLTQRWHRIHDGSGVVSGDNGPWSLAGSWFHTPVPTPAAPPCSRSLIRLQGESGNLAKPLGDSGRGTGHKEGGWGSWEHLLSARTWQSTCAHIMQLKIVSVLVVLSPAHSCFSKAPPVDKRLAASSLRVSPERPCHATYTGAQ